MGDTLWVTSVVFTSELVPRAVVTPAETRVPLLSSRLVLSFCLKAKVRASGSNCQRTAWRSRPLLSDFFPGKPLPKLPRQEAVAG